MSSLSNKRRHSGRFNLKETSTIFNDDNITRNKQNNVENLIMRFEILWDRNDQHKLPEMFRSGHLNELAGEGSPSKKRKLKHPEFHSSSSSPPPSLRSSQWESRAAARPPRSGRTTTRCPSSLSTARWSQTKPRQGTRTSVLSRWPACWTSPGSTRGRSTTSAPGRSAVHGDGQAPIVSLPSSLGTEPT